MDVEMPDIRGLIFRLGGPVKVGKIVGRTHSAVCQWTRIPTDYVPALVEHARKRGDTLTARDLRPDINWGLIETKRRPGPKPKY